MTQEELLKFNIDHVKNSIIGIEKRAGATKKELALFFGKSVPTIDRAIRNGGYDIPEYIKGEGQKAHVFFPLINIALFLSNQTIKTASDNKNYNK